MEEALKLVFKIGSLIAEAAETRDAAKRAQLIADAQSAQQQLGEKLASLDVKLDARNAEMLRRAREKAGESPPQPEPEPSILDTGKLVPKPSDR